MTALNYCQISGSFDGGDGSPLSGTAVFQPSQTVYSSGLPLVSVDTPIEAQIVDGVLRSASGGTLELLATDNSGLSYLGQTGWFAWEVSITLAGQVLQPWNFFLPFGSLGAGPVDLYSLANTGTGGGSGSYLPLPSGTPTTGQVPAVVTVSPLALDWASSGGGGGGSGTVTSVAVEAANGFTGTVAGSTAAAQITLGTSVTGLLKGAGAAIAAASAGTDYLAPGGSGSQLTGLTQAQVGGLVTALGLLATLTSPALSGTPTAPTATALTNNTQIATTAYADTAVSVEKSRAQTAEGNAAQKSANLSDLASAATARSNLGLGTAAQLTSGAVAQTANNLSDMQSEVTARTNLGLGTAAVLNAGAVAQTANNLSDLASIVTARTNLGLGSAATQPSSAFDASGAASGALASAIAACLPTMTQAGVSASGTLAVNVISEVTATSAIVAMALPASVTNDLIVVERAAASTFNVTITGNIRGVAATTITLQLSNESEIFLGYGGSWWPIGGHKTLSSLQALFAQLANNLSDLPSASAARTNLGLGSAATQPSSAFLSSAGGAVAGPLSTTPVTLTDAATITVNAALSNFARVTLGGSRTLGTPSGPADGQPLTVEVIQPASGGPWTLSYSAAYSFPASCPQPSLSTAAGSRDFISFVYDAGVSLWVCTGYVLAQNAGVVTPAQGGTGQTSLAAALTALAGVQASGQYLRSNGTATALSAIQAADLPSTAVTPGSYTGTNLTVDAYGRITAAANGSGGSGMANPMTTLGDLIYENATPAPARLAGQTSAAKNFLTQTGTGSVSAAPAWGAIAAGDLPAATTSAQGAVIIDGTATDIQPTGTQAAGSSIKAAAANHVHFSSGQYLCAPSSYAPAGQSFLTTPAPTTIASGSNGGEISQVASWAFPSAGVLAVASTATFPSSGTLSITASGSTTAVVTYTGTTGTTFTGCAYVSGSATGTVATAGGVGVGVLTAFSSANISTGAFAAPASGSVIVTVSCASQISAAGTCAMFGLAAHGTATAVGNLFNYTDGNGGETRPVTMTFLVTGLTPGTVYNFDLMGAVGAGGGTVSVVAYGATSVGAAKGAPVIMTVQAV